MVFNPRSRRTSLGYGLHDRLITKQLANAVTATYTYDLAGQLTGLRHTNSVGTVLERLTYTYDLASRRTTLSYLNGDVIGWGYDPSGPLSHQQRTGTNSYNVTYTCHPARHH